MMGIHTMRFVPIILIFWLFSVGNASAQNKKPTVESNPPNNCESNQSFLTSMHGEAGEHGLIIAIARLGTGEQSRSYNARRLYNIRKFLIEYRGRMPSTLITAEGDPVRGRGRVDFYIGGKLLGSFIVDHGEDIPLGACEGHDYDFYPQKKRKIR